MLFALLLSTIPTLSLAKNGPDVTIDEIHVMPDLWDAGTPWNTVGTFLVRIKNKGNSASPQVGPSDEATNGVRVEVTIDGSTDLVTYYLPALNPGQTTTKVYYFDVVGEGETIQPGFPDPNTPFIVKLDPNNVFNEANEINNHALYYPTTAHPVMMGFGTTATAVYNIDSALLNIDVFYEERLNEPIATGTATFYDNGTVIPGCQNVALGSFPDKISNEGSAYCTFSSTVLGEHTLTAAYSGDGYYPSMNSSPITVTVHEYPPTPASDQVFTVSEVAADGTEVGTVAVDGPTATGFAIIDGNTDSAFSIDNNGVIKVNNSSAIDYEVVSSYTLLIESTNGTISGSGTVVVNVDDVSYTATAVAGANGSLDVSTPSPQTVEHGDTATFTFNADANYHLTSITGCGINYTNSSNAVTSYTATTEPMTGDCTVNASFGINKYTTTAVAGANGSLDVSTPSPQTVEHGDTATFTFNADANYHLASITGCGINYTNSSNAVTSYTATTEPMTGDCTVNASFGINKYTTTAVAGANGSLDVSTPSPQTVEHGDTATFTFNADANYHLASITGCGINYTNSSDAVTSYTATTDAMTGDCTVNASFGINKYTIPTLGKCGMLALAGILGIIILVVIRRRKVPA